MTTKNIVYCTGPENDLLKVADPRKFAVKRIFWESQSEALQVIEGLTGCFDCAVIEVPLLAGNVLGIGPAEKFRKKYPHTPIILLETIRGSVEEYMRSHPGLVPCTVLSLPVRPSALRDSINRITTPRGMSLYN